MPRRLPRLVGKMLESAMVFDGEKYHALCGKGLEIARQDFICYDITTTENLELGDRVMVVVVCVGLAAISGPMCIAFLVAAFNAGAKQVTMSIEDYQSGNVRDSWHSLAQVTLSAVEGGLSGAVATVLPGVGMVAVNAAIGVEFGKLDRALEYHELLSTDYEKWLEVVNDPEAELWDIAWSVVPDLVVGDDDNERKN